MNSAALIVIIDLKKLDLILRHFEPGAKRNLVEERNLAGRCSVRL